MCLLNRLLLVSVVPGALTALRRVLAHRLEFVPQENILLLRQVRARIVSLVSFLRLPDLPFVQVAPAEVTAQVLAPRLPFLACRECSLRSRQLCALIALLVTILRTVDLVLARSVLPEGFVRRTACHIRQETALQANILYLWPRHVYSAPAVHTQSLQLLHALPALSQASATSPRHGNNYLLILSSCGLHIYPEFPATR